MNEYCNAFLLKHLKMDMYFIASVKMFGIRKTYSETFENALGIFSCFLTSGHGLLLVAVLDLERRLLW